MVHRKSRKSRKSKGVAVPASYGALKDAAIANFLSKQLLVRKKGGYKSRSRSSKGALGDLRKRSKIVFNPDSISKANWNKWLRRPDKFDLHGIDDGSYAAGARLHVPGTTMSYKKQSHLPVWAAPLLSKRKKYSRKSLRASQKARRKSAAKKRYLKMTSAQKAKRRSWAKKYYKKLSSAQKAKRRSAARKYYKKLSSAQKAKRRSAARRYYKKLSSAQKAKRRSAARKMYAAKQLAKLRAMNAGKI